MTKTEATRQARRQIRFGYFRPTETVVQIRCPRCRLHTMVTTSVQPWDKDGARAKAAVAALVEHLMDEH